MCKTRALWITVNFVRVMADLIMPTCEFRHGLKFTFRAASSVDMCNWLSHKRPQQVHIISAKFNRQTEWSYLHDWWKRWLDNCIVSHTRLPCPRNGKTVALRYSSEHTWNAAVLQECPLSSATYGQLLSITTGCFQTTHILLRKTIINRL